MQRYKQDYTKTTECSKNHHAFAKLDNIMNYIYIYINENVKINSELLAKVLVSWYYFLLRYIQICDDTDKIIPKLQSEGGSPTGLWIIKEQHQALKLSDMTEKGNE
jgi:hypothetical protein